MSRTAIHAHCAARFKNDHGLIDRTSEVYKGWFALKNSVGKVFINETDIENFNKIMYIRWSITFGYSHIRHCLPILYN